MIKIGARNSPLALAQAEIVNQQLRAMGCATMIVPILTTGDKLYNISLAKAGGKGLFLKEIQEALLNKSIDLAVHSMKDMPVSTDDDLIVTAVLKRANPFDVMITKENIASIHDLKQNAVIGTSSARRIAMFRSIRPDCILQPIRGNINTRLAKLLNKTGEAFDAIILAKAGLDRLGDTVFDKSVKEAYLIDLDEVFIPAVGQGAIGIECRADDVALQKLVSPLNCDFTHKAVLAERKVMEVFGGDCTTAIGAYAKFEPDHQGVPKFQIKAVYYKDGIASYAEAIGDVADYLDIAQKVGLKIAKAAEAI